MSAAAWVLLVAGVFAIYPYFGYPALLWLFARFRSRRPPAGSVEWPRVSVTVPVYNEAPGIRGVLERTLSFDYPRDRLQVLVMSDASTDGTDDIVREFSSRGVELVRLP